MCASAKPFQRQPVTGAPVPLHQWRPGQTIGQFLEELRMQGFVIAVSAGNYIMIRKH